MLISSFQFIINCVRGTRTQPLICVGCSAHYWVSCAINNGGFFEIAFVVVVVVDTHLPRFEALAWILRMDMDLNLKKIGQLFQLLMPCPVLPDEICDIFLALHKHFVCG